MDQKDNHQQTKKRKHVKVSSDAVKEFKEVAGEETAANKPVHGFIKTPEKERVTGLLSDGTTDTKDNHDQNEQQVLTTLDEATTKKMYKQEGNNGLSL